MADPVRNFSFSGATGSQSTSALTINSGANTVAVGDVLTLAVATLGNTGAAATACSVSDSLGNTWLAQQNVQDNTARLDLFTCVAAAGGAVTITITPNTSRYIAACCADHGNVPSSSFIDGTVATNLQGGTTAPTLTLTTTNGATKDAIFCAVCTSGAGTSCTSPGAPWTELANFYNGTGATTSLEVIEQIAAAGTFTPTWTTPAEDALVMGIALKGTAPPVTPTIAVAQQHVVTFYGGRR